MKKISSTPIIPDYSSTHTSGTIPAPIVSDRGNNTAPLPAPGATAKQQQLQREYIQTADLPRPTKRRRTNASSAAASSSALNETALAALRGEIGRLLPRRLQRLLGSDGYRSLAEREYVYWLLPAEHRFMAALLDCTWRACDAHRIPLTSATTDVLLQHALQAVADEMNSRPHGAVARFMQNEEHACLRTLVEEPSEFAPRAEETDQCFARVASAIETL